MEGIIRRLESSLLLVAKAQGRFCVRVIWEKRQHFKKSGSSLGRMGKGVGHVVITQNKKCDFKLFFAMQPRERSRPLTHAQCHGGRVLWRLLEFALKKTLDTHSLIIGGRRLAQKGFGHLGVLSLFVWSSIDIPVL